MAFFIVTDYKIDIKFCQKNFQKFMIIDTNAQLTPNFKKIISRTGVERCGNDYHVVSIVGAQSSGKSTLLNKVFGTKFKTMDENIGRQQTTKGIQCDLAVSSPIFLIDPEGSDSRERGDVDALFERKAALFSIALSDVIIVNMWETDIGRYKAANIPLLQAAFEANVQLFAKYRETVTNVVFVIRDLSTNHKEPLFNQLLNDMECIWKDIHLPDEIKDSKVTDFFDFKFESTRHMKIDPDGFNEDVKRIRGEFASDFFWPKNSTKIVPAESLACYIEKIWTVINENKELNIPSQRELISRIKCVEAVNLAMEKFKKHMARKSESKKAMEFSVKRANDVYNEATWKYIDSVVKEQRRFLYNQMYAIISPILKKKAIDICAAQIDEFKKGTLKNECVLTDDGKWENHTTKRIRRRLSLCENEIKSIVPEGIEWNYDLSGFLETINEIINESKQRISEETVNALTEEVLEIFNKKVYDIYAIPTNKTWNEVSNLVDEYTNILKEKTKAVFTANNIDVPEVDAAVFIESAENIAKDNARFIVLKMKTVFDKSFLYTEKNLPRVWKQGDNINEIYEASRAKGLQILKFFTFMNIKDNPKILISNANVEICKETFERTIIHEYEQARNILDNSSGKRRIAPWAIFLCLILGYDWILFALTNPFIFIIAVMCLTFFVLKKSSLIGPILEIASERLEQERKPEKRSHSKLLKRAKTTGKLVSKVKNE